MPRFNFQAGEPLLASQLNTFLMDQSVMVFDDESARTTALPSPAEGMVTYLKDLKLVKVWDGSEWDEVSGGGSITVSSTAPGEPEEGDLWFNDVSGKTFVYYTDNDSSQWVEVGQAGGLATATVVTSSTRPSTPIEGQVIFESDTGLALVLDGSAWVEFSGGGSIEISATAPASPDDGDLWWDSDNGNLYIYYDDGDSEQWVAANGPQVFVGTSAPAGYQGQLWFDSSTGKTYIYYDDGSSAQWVSAIGGSVAGSVVDVKSVLKTDTFSASVAAGGNVAVTDLEITHTLKNASNKLLVMAYFGVAGSDQGYGGVGIAIADDGTLINVGDASGSRTSVSAGGYVTQAAASYVVTMPHISFLYEPGDTSSHTYTVRAIALENTTTTVYINRSETDGNETARPRGVSALTIQEIAG